ncbi:uncharacterized protein LOC132200754 [Neocloeon triangulifer]|uniref:uncharacterized protein LOC132200754 n=1 Tax=Neocloeon triangulifer TaxID=2078957 RepID=UPI00286EED91|nr:uncharacterized protein LOC132200754 [Neocloeon triangulifer]XP_059482427.1 uncharacterized protein LOC132200754 [Neocloeon triangulifer]
MDQQERENMKYFVLTMRNNLKQFCDDVGWECPSVSNENIKKHYEKTAVEERNAAPMKDDSKEIDLFPEFYDSNRGCSLLITPDEVSKVISHAGCGSVAEDMRTPKSAFELQMTYNPAQRLAIYEHVTNLTKDKVPQLPLTELDLVFEPSLEQDKSEKSRFDVLNEERNAKRRRINYKQAKKVHTHNKTHTEVMAEVIKNQMEVYQEWLAMCGVGKNTAQTSQAETKSKNEGRLDLSSVFVATLGSSEKKRERSRSPRSHNKHGKKHHKEKSKKRSRSRERKHGKKKKNKDKRD